MPLLLNLLPARFLLTLREWFDYKISHCVVSEYKEFLDTWAVLQEEKFEENMCMSDYLAFYNRFAM